MNLIQILTNENTIIIYAIKILYAIVQPILYYRITSIILNIHPTNTHRNLFIVILSTISAIALFIPTGIIKDLMVIIIFALLLHSLLKLNIKNAMLAVFISEFSTIISESIVVFISVSVLKIDLYCLQNIPIYNFIGQLFGSILLYFSPNLLEKINNSFLKINVHISSKIIIIITFILGLTTMILEAYMLSINLDKIPLPLTILIIVSTLLYFLAAMYGLVRTNILDKTKEDLENAKLYNQTLSLLHDNIRGFRHDFNNIVQSIGGYLALNDISGLKIYYEKLLQDCKLTNNLNLLNPEAINNPPIYSLLTNKYFLATQKRIHVNFSIYSDLSKITSNVYEISRILGILLDNAIEAAEESEEKIVDIEVKFDNRKQTFKIMNSCKDTNISTTKIFEKGYSTKNRNSGLGLWNVHKILSKNTDLDLYTTIENNMFSQQLYIYY